jgi:5-methyltetrahydropteroyltriglutamate--homocysteine methyltransferase
MSPIATAVVGSYPQPDWLVDKARYRDHVVPRVRMPDLWRVPADLLEAAQDDAVRLAVRDLELAGVDIVSDGEQRRESYFNQFATGLTGVDLDRPGTAMSRLGRPIPVPRIVGPIAREHPVFLRDARFLRALTRRRIKIAVPGPFTLAQLAEDEHYKDDAKLAMAYAEAVNAELRDLEPVADVLQLDEPYVEPRADRARHYALPVIDRALAGLRKPTCIHVCMGYAYSHALAGTTKQGRYAFVTELARSAATLVSVEAAQPRLDVATLAPLAASKTIVLGVLDLGDPAPETAAAVASRLGEALRHVPRERLVAAPDCGMKYLPRATALEKLRALVEGAQRV